MRKPAHPTCGTHPRLGCVFALLAAVGSAAPAFASDPENCLLCHRYRGLGRFDGEAQRVHLFYVNPDYQHWKLGSHAQLACTACHLRSEVGVIPHRAVSPVDCTRACHITDARGLELRFSHDNIPPMLEQSAHLPEAMGRLQFARGPMLAAGQSVCLFCHDEPLFRDPERAIPLLTELGSRTFDRCEVCHQSTVPVDVAYYLRHIASRLLPARPTLELAQVCAVCHSDPGVLGQHPMHDAVASYMRSFHGKAALLGDLRTANCLSCHVAPGENVHLMLAPANPRSAVNAARVADSCRSVACHPGADKSLAAAGVHLDLAVRRGVLEFVVALAFIVLTVLTFGPSMLIVVLELFNLLIGVARQGHRELQRLVQALLASPQGRRLLTRFTVHQRIQHWVLALLFVLLVLTGFPMKFADRQWSRIIIEALGGLSVARTIHHWSGLALVAGVAYHVVYAAWTMLRRRKALGAARPGWLETLLSLPMWLGPTDARKALHLLGYLLFLRREPPTFGRFGVKEKFEYIGVFWGTVLLGVTGAMLWGEQLTTHVFGGRILNIALIAHTYEAFLAIIHVGILHMINVLLSPNVFPLSRATLTGETPAAELAEAHSEQVLEVARQLGISTDLTR